MNKNPANFVPLSPISFLHRTADIYADYPSVVYENRSYTWSESRERCVRIASSLKDYGIKTGDTVSVLAFNTPEMFESHFSIPMAGAILNTINIRLDAATIAYIFDDSNAKMLFVDRELFSVASEALSIASVSPKIVVINDSFAESQPDVSSDITDYESLVMDGDPLYDWQMPDDEWSPLSLSYTSGTTGKPKGVVYHHRGSYLMSMGTVIGWNLPNHPVYLYSVPLFHCNGWGHAWTMAALAGTIICLRSFAPEKVFSLLDQHNVTHFGGAPIMLNMLANAPKEIQKSFTREVKVMTAGAPPPAKVLEGMMSLGFNVMHVYGLTETYGHILQAAPQASWLNKNPAELAKLSSRQGVRFPMTEDVSVIDQETGRHVPHNGEAIGEIVIRCNTCMMGYWNNPEATEEAFADGWFHSGDLAVIYADGYIQIKDRSKDIIISGGENISSVEVENVLYQHSAVGEAAVVAMPDETWGEVPCAFVELKSNQQASEKELIEFCKNNMAKFKRPKKVVFGPLPKTATGKIQKHELRASVKNLGEK